MEEATIKALHRVINRQEEILSGDRWMIGKRLKEFQETLKAATNYKKPSEKPSETTSEEPMGME